MEITKVVKPFIRRGWPNTFGNTVCVCVCVRACVYPVFYFVEMCPDSMSFIIVLH